MNVPAKKLWGCCRCDSRNPDPKWSHWRSRMADRGLDQCRGWSRTVCNGFDAGRTRERVQSLSSSTEGRSGRPACSAEFTETDKWSDIHEADLQRVKEAMLRRYPQGRRPLGMEQDNDRCAICTDQLSAVRTLVESTVEDVSKVFCSHEPLVVGRPTRLTLRPVRCSANAMRLPIGARRRVVPGR